MREEGFNAHVVAEQLEADTDYDIVVVDVLTGVESDRLDIHTDAEGSVELDVSLEAIAPIHPYSIHLLEQGIERNTVRDVKD